MGPQRTLRPPSALPADFYPGKGFRSGRPIPEGFAVVTRSAYVRKGEVIRTRLTCPRGYRMQSLATTTGRIGFLVPREDRKYYLRLRSVRMDVFRPSPAPQSPRSPSAHAAARSLGSMAGLCRRVRR